MRCRAARYLLALCFAVAFGLTKAVGLTPSGPAGLGVQSLLPQSAQKGTGLILGRVVDGTTGSPVSSARVICSCGPPWLATDSEGRFVFFDLPAGIYRFTVTKPGYMGGELGERWAGATAPLTMPGMTNPRAQSLTLGADERRSDVTIRLWKEGAITGRVTDERGEPLVGVLVQAWSEEFRAGHVTLNSALPVIGQTDDRGIYRIVEVPPGRYVVVVAQPRVTTPAESLNRPRSSSAAHGADLESINTIYRIGEPVAGSSTAVRVGDWLQWLAPPSVAVPAEGGAQNLGYRTTFYSDTATASKASQVVVPPGEDVTGIDLNLKREPVFRVSGWVTGPAGPASNVTLRLIEASDGASSFPTARTGTAVSDASGKFMFLGVPPGDYSVQVVETPRTDATDGWQPPNASDFVFVYQFSADFSLTAPTLWGSVPVVVAGDVADVQVVLRQGARLTGSVQFEGSTPRPAPAMLAKMNVLIDRADGSLPTMRASRELKVEPTGEFHSIGLPPGRYFVRVPQPPAGWVLQSVEVNGRDVSVDPLELREESVGGIAVRLTDRPSVVSGAVRTKDGVADGAASVAVFPADSKRWIDYGWQPRQITSARVDEKGHYEIRGLPRGDYMIVAIDDAAMAVWNSPDLFVALSRIAERLQLSDGDLRVVDLITKTVSK